MQKAWLKATAEVMKGKYDKADAVDPNFLNHVTWYVDYGVEAPLSGRRQDSIARTPGQIGHEVQER